MKLSTKLLMLTGSLMAALVMVCATALWESYVSQTSNEQSYKSETLATSYLADANSSLWALRWGVAQYLSLTDPAQRLKLVEADRKHYGDFEKHLQAFQDQPVTETVRTAAKEVKEDFQKYATARIRWLELMGEGKAEEAAKLRAETLTPAGGATVAAINKTIDLERKDAETSFKARNANLSNTSIWLVAICVLTLVTAVIVTLLVVRGLLRQLGGEPGTAAELAHSVAQGDLSVHIEVRPGDKTSLMAQLQVMQASLVNVVSHVRQGSESVSTASAEIAQGNQDLSARTESQASALEETAASMEELSSTVRQNADNAKQANQLAQTASTVAIQGGEVVAQVVSTMKEINDSSKKISDIIGVIDGIAFQTNILALNAAVEAARAGELGRGFAVVASEVRSLAGRSAEAAKEIKSLINASVERVEHGSALVDKAGTTMNEVVGSIRRVTDIMGEISAASSEQSAEVAQVGEAVTQMDQATQQNAALVEEMAAAASSLTGQAQELVQTVAIFKLAQGEGSFASHSSSARPQRIAHQFTPPSKNPASAPKAKSMKTPTPKLSAPPAAPKSVPAGKGESEDWESF